MRQILHVSDIHFGPKHLPAVAAGISRLVAARRPALVVISGDQTQRAKPHQFRQARRWAAALPVPVLAVPGNHDVPMYRFWERLIVPFRAYRRHFSSELEPVWRDEELLVAGVNTAHNWTIKNGRLRPEQLRRLTRAIEGDTEDRFRIVVAHHPIVEAPDFHDRSVVRHAARARSELARLGIHLVLSGHLHVSFLHVWRVEASPPFALVHGGTAASSRGRGWERGHNTCNWITIEPHEVRVEQLVWSQRSDRFEGQRELVLPREADGRLTGDVRRRSAEPFSTRAVEKPAENV